MTKRFIALIGLLTALGCSTSNSPAPYPTTYPTTDPRVSATPLALDPLTPQEEARAAEILLGNAEARSLLGENPRVIYVVSIAPKLRAGDDEPRGRHADLLYLRADKRHGVRALIDLAEGRVVATERVATPAVPLGTSDVEEALSIVNESGRLRELMGRQTAPFRVLRGPITREAAQSNFVQGLQHVGASPDDPCSRDRCVYLLFNSGGRLVLQDQEVLVNLTRREVRVTRAGGGQ